MIQQIGISRGGQTACELYCRPVSSEADADFAGLSEIFAGRKFPSILGGNNADTESNRFSYWAAEPLEVFEFHSSQDNPFVRLQHVLAKYKLEGFHSNNLPAGIFCGGWIGYFSYELGRYIEKLPQNAVDDIGMPIIRLCFYDRVICYDRLEKKYWLFALQMADEESAEDKLAAMERLISRCKSKSVTEPAPANMDEMDFSLFGCNMSKEYYIEAVRKIKQYIIDGDIYQVNFSQRFDYDFHARPIDLYHWQNRYNPSPYAAYIDAGDSVVVSASPEMYVTVGERLLWTKPIKGTRPKIPERERFDRLSRQSDERNFNELLHSEKEKAELNMIIDLERNDLARICEYGSIKVVQPRTIETYPTVFHAVATVQGTLRREIDFCGILKAMFPGGSITGAPKIRSIEIIGELEPTQRGVYTGSVGFIGLNGNVCLNIAIRTVIIRNQKAFAQTGGGIVADSHPESEWDESLTKARALVAGINAVQRSEKRIKCTIREAT